MTRVTTQADIHHSGAVNSQATRSMSIMGTMVRKQTARKYPSGSQNIFGARDSPVMTMVFPLAGETRFQPGNDL